MSQRPETSRRMVIKIMPEADWTEACGAGVYLGSPDDLRDGFVHFSTEDQVTETAAKYFAGQLGLVVIGFHSRDLGSELKWEPSREGALFPHLYGPLKTKDALFVCPLELDPQGHVVLPTRVAP